MERSPEEEERLRKRAENRANNEIYQWGKTYLLLGLFLVLYAIFVLVAQTLIGLITPIVLLILLVGGYFLFKS